jgi:LysM repeat protein
MRKRVAVLAFIAVLGACFLPGTAQAADENQDAPKGAAAWPDGLRYKVSAGDTLWDLSAKYLGSPWKWPELWERNRFLTNPHYIYPGTEITIFPPPARDYSIVGAPPPRPVPVADAQTPGPASSSGRSRRRSPRSGRASRPAATSSPTTSSSSP